MAKISRKQAASWRAYRAVLFSFYFVFVFLFVFVSPDRVSLCHAVTVPELPQVDQAGLEFTEIHLPLPPESWD